MKRLLIIIVFILLGVTVWAQKTLEGGIQFSAVSYYGDIEKYDYLKSTSPGIGIFARYNFNERMALRGQFLYSKLKSEGLFGDAYIAQPGGDGYLFARDESQMYTFGKSFLTFEILYEYNFFKYKMGSTVARFTPYITLGYGLFYSQAGKGGSFILEPEVAMALDGISRYNRYEPQPGKRTDQLDTFSPVVPFGMGVKWNATKKLALNAEVLFRKTFTDNIDNLIDPKRFKNVEASDVSNDGESAYDESFANSEIHNSDWFSSISVSITYMIWNGKKKCRFLKTEKN
jgi:hypothetical protein